MVGAAGIPIYPGGGRLRLSACPVWGWRSQKKLPPTLPPMIISGTALTYITNAVDFVINIIGVPLPDMVSYRTCV